MPNRLTLLYSKIYYKEENYLKVELNYNIYNKELLGIVTALKE